MQSIPRGELSMRHLTLQEVIERIRKMEALSKDRRAQDSRLEYQPHRPEFYVPRITRRLVGLMFLAK
jgi:hypothetical protein